MTENNTQSTNTFPKEVSGWSWGGSFATTVTLAGSKNWVLLIVYLLLSFVPFVNIISWIVFFILWWLQGKKWIWESKAFDSDQEKIWAIKFAESVGILFAILFVLLILLWVVAGAFIASQLNSIAH